MAAHDLQVTDQKVDASSSDDRAAKVDEIHTATPKRNFGLLNITAAAFNILQAWGAIGATFALGIGHGGSVTLVYGLIFIFLIYTAISLSMAEMAAKYPTAGGQYHWTAILAPKGFKRGLSYLCGSINTIGWISLCASATIIPPQIVVGVISAFDKSYTIQRWHVFLLYQALNLFALLYNLFALQKLPWTHDIAFVISMTSFVVITITCLVIASPKQSSTSIWQGFQNDTGWSSSGFVFFTGLINLNFGFAGMDGAVHLAEECLNAATAVPWALVSAVLASFATSIIFLVAMLYCARDFDAVINTSTQVPIFAIWQQATRSPVAATIFVIVLASIISFALIAALQTSSRLTWSFARDDALIFSKYLQTLDRRLNVPAWALFFNSFWIFLIGCVYLASSTAFNAIVGPALILEQVSFAFPAALLLLRRRQQSFLPDDGPFRFGKAGWLVNGVTVAWAIMEVVFYSLPPVRPVTGGNMNYTCVVLAGIGLFILVNWFAHAKQRFQGPTVELDLIWLEN